MNLIVAVDKNWAIGKDGDQLVYLSEDLKRFKALTTGHPVILGRKTPGHLSGGTAPEGPPEPHSLPERGLCPGGGGGVS